MSRTKVGESEWAPSTAEPKHGDYRPGSFHIQGQVSGSMWQTAHQRWCSSCKGWKPVAGVTGNLACPDCKAVWMREAPAKRKPEPQPMMVESPCNCPLCQPYFPDKRS